MNVGLAVSLSVGVGFLLVVSGVSIFATVLIHRSLGKKQSSSIESHPSTTANGEAAAGGGVPTVETSFTSTSNEYYSLPSLTACNAKDYGKVLPP